MRRLNSAAGGVAATPSPLENREVLGEARDVSGNGYASLVSRRRLPGRDCVGDVSPNRPGLFNEMDVFRVDPPAAGVAPSLLASVGGLIGEFTEPLKSCKG